MDEHELSKEDVGKVARLARLSLTDAQAEGYRRTLGAVLGYVQQLQRLDLSGVAPLTHVAPPGDRLAEDRPADPLPLERLMEMAPDTMPPFLKVPRVFGESGA